MKKLLAGLAIAYLLLAAIGLVTLPARLRDVPAPDDADLIAEPGASPAPEGNAFLQLVVATRSLDLDDETREMLSAALKENRAPTGFRALLAGHEDAMAAARAALDLPESQLVFPPGVVGEAQSALQLRVQDVVKLLSARGVSLAQQGVCPDAYDEIDAALRLTGRLHETRNADLVLAMLSTASERVALRAGDSVVSDCPLSAEGSRGWQRRIESSRPAASAWADPVHVEYRILKQLFVASEIEDWGGPRLPTRLLSSYSLQKNRTLSELARGYRQAAAWTCEDTPEPLSHPSPGVLTMLVPNGIGRLMLAVSAPDYGKYRIRTCAVLAERSAHMARAALQAWETDHGELPENLDALLPSYLAFVPLDPFSAGPLQFSSKQRRLSTAGEPSWTLP